MKFAYTALTGENKKMTGVLDTESMETAQAELHKMGVAIIDVNEISEEEYEKMKKEQKEAGVAKGIQTFTFIAIDPSGKDIEGTIDAVDDYSAFKRLKSEYKFSIKDLYLSSATDEEKERAKGMLESFESRYSAEEETAKQEEKQVDESDEEISHELVQEIDNLIVNTKSLLESKSELFSTDLIREIQGALGELELIRTSNNIRHITEVSNTLYELISNPDKVQGDIQDEDYKTIMSRVEESALIKKEFDLYKKAIAVTGAKRIFKNIADKLKVSTLKEDPKKPLSAIKKAKIKLYNLFSRLSAVKPKPKKNKSKNRLIIAIESLNNYLKAPSPALKKARKKELAKAVKALFGKKYADNIIEEKVKEPEAKEKKDLKQVKKKEEVIEVISEKEITGDVETAGKKKDFGGIFIEIDSFLSWLLCFYIIYFFLVDFSIEKNFGLSMEFIYSTLKTPLILDITIFLLIFHLVLRIKNLHFRKNFIASAFLMFLGIGLFAMIILNF